MSPAGIEPTFKVYETSYPPRRNGKNYCRVCLVCVIRIAMTQKTTWEIYPIQHCRGPGCAVRERYQFVDGHGKRRHFSTKTRPNWSGTKRRPCPLSTIEKPRITRARPAILSVAEFRALLNRARSQERFDVLSWLVLGGLVGLRPSEVLRLEWAGIQFQTREIRIEPGWTKTHRARVIPLQRNALEWLRLIAASAAEKTGRVMPLESTWNNRWRRWRQDEDAPLPLVWWNGKDDVLRHSYGTCRAAILRNSHNLAEEMGNSVTIIRT